jgi:WD40 repeat protein
MAFPGAPVALAWRPDGRALAVGTQDGFLQVWRQSGPRAGRARSGAGSSQLTMRGYPAKVSCLDWHPTRSRIATAGGQDVVLWDIPTAGEGKPMPLRLHRAAVTALVHSPDGALLASGDRDGRLCIWRDGGAPVHSITLDAEISALAWHAGGAAIAVGCIDGKVAVLDIDIDTAAAGHQA